MRKFINGLFPLNRALAILLITNSSVLISIAMLAPIWAIFVENKGGGILETGLASSVLAITAGFVVILTGKISDEVKNNELVVVLGYFILAIGFVLYNFVDSLLFLAAVQIIVGIGVAIYNPAFDALYSKHLKKHAMGREWGTWEGMAYFSEAFGAGIGAVIAATLGFNVLFVVMAILCLMSAVYIYFLPRKVL